MFLEEFNWVDKYRPKLVKDVILPDNLKVIFYKIIEQGHCPNYIFWGKAGSGKTTVAKAILNELGCDYIVINGSKDGNIDTLRNEIANFASSVSFTGTKKYVIIDEADGMNPNSMQPALKAFIEEFSKNCGFIFTCNNKNRIIPEIHSRAPVIDFNISKKDMPKLAAQFMKAAEGILIKENIPYQKDVLATVISKHCPDWRRVLNELQKYSATGAIDSGILVNMQAIPVKQLLSLCKEKKFDDIRKWTAENSDMDQSDLFAMIYEQADTVFEKSSIPVLILKIADYQYKAAFVANPELNILAFFIEVISECEFL